jgi:hypothetical protein
MYLSVLLAIFIPLLKIPAIFLPLSKFVGASESKVWKESRSSV